MKHVSAPYEVCQRGMTVVEAIFFGGGRVSWKDDIGIATAFSLSSPHHVNMKSGQIRATSARSPKLILKLTR